MPFCSHPLPQAQGLNTQGGPWGHAGNIRGGCPFLQHGKEAGWKSTMAERAWKMTSVPNNFSVPNFIFNAKSQRQ